MGKMFNKSEYWIKAHLSFTTILFPLTFSIPWITVCAVFMHFLLALPFDLIIQLLGVSEWSHLWQSAYYKAFGQWE